MKIVALMGSPRKKGNTDILADSFLEGAAVGGAESEKIYLNGLNMRGCQACLSCHKTGRCSQKDDMQGIYAKLKEAELWVLATPVYWWGPTSQIKAVIDRLYAFDYGENRKSVEGKQAVLIGAFFDEAEEATPYMLGMLRASMAYLKVGIAGEIMVRAGKKGEVKSMPKELDRARELGHKLTDDESLFERAGPPG